MKLSCSAPFRRTLGMAVFGLGLAARVTYGGAAGRNDVEAPQPVRVLQGDKQLWHPSEQDTSYQSAPAPGDGRIESLATDPLNLGRVLLSRGGALWISHDEGRSWDGPIFRSETEQAVAAAFHPTDRDTFLLASNERLLISNDAGRDWTPAQPGLQFNWRPRTVLVSRGQPNRVYLTTRGDGIFRSDDGGRTWRTTNGGLPKGIGAAPVAPVDSAAVDPTDSDTVYVTLEAHGVYKTSNGGATWTRASTGLPDLITHRTFPWVLTIDPANPLRVLVWTHRPLNSEVSRSAFFLSQDGGANWRKVAAVSEQGRVFDIQFVDAQIGLAVAVTEDQVIVLSN